MREWLLDFICCPSTRQRLTPQEVVWKDGRIESGRLVTGDGLIGYPIIAGVPRLLPGIRDEADLRRVYADSFGHQWTTFAWERQQDEQEFFSVSHHTPASLRGLTVLDAGCGGGRVSRVMGQHCKRLIGLDYSIAVDRARQHCGDLDHCEFVQGDVLRPPLMREQFDFVWSHGVLHHTPSTRAGFEQLARLVTPGGELHIIVFLKTFWPMRLLDTCLRSVVRRLPYAVAARVCRGMGVLRRMPGASFLKRFVWFSQQPTPELRTYCNFDWYMPRYHHEHSWPEVSSWFASAGFEEVSYLNGWPDAPAGEKRTPPGFSRQFRLGQLLGAIGRRPKPAPATPSRFQASTPARPAPAPLAAPQRSPLRPQRTCVILQPGYLPWLGFFEQVARADEFVFLDDVQYDKHGWRNRNRIKGPSGGPQWLTVPVRVSHLGRPLINAVEIDATQERWIERHLNALRACYGPCRWFEWLFPNIERVLRRPERSLANLDIALIELLCQKLELRASFRRSSEMNISAARCERLVEICQRLSCGRYYSGAAATAYLDIEMFQQAGIEVEFQEYAHPVYPQRFGEFRSHLSVVDLMFNCGPASLDILTASTRQGAWRAPGVSPQPVQGGVK